MWDSIRFEVAKRNEKGLFILTESSATADGITAHTETGRIIRFKMRPMSLYKSLKGTGEISLLELFTGLDDNSGISKLELSDIARLIVLDGWPSCINDYDERAYKAVIDYV